MRAHYFQGKRLWKLFPQQVEETGNSMLFAENHCGKDDHWCEESVDCLVAFDVTLSFKS